MVFQSLALFPHLNVIDNVGYALEIAGVNKATRLKRSQELLDLVGLTDLGNGVAASFLVGNANVLP